MMTDWLCTVAHKYNNYSDLLAKHVPVKTTRVPIVVLLTLGWPMKYYLLNVKDEIINVSGIIKINR